MTPGFSVKFVIDRLTANYKIQITDTTDYTGVSTAYGFYRIEYPDGLWVENTDLLNPDFQLGQTFSEFTFRLKNFVPMAGQYRIIQKTYADTGDVQTTKTITFSFVEPSMSLVNSSNMAVPSVSFTDTTSYDLGFYTEVVTKTITGTFPLSLPFGGTQVSTSGNTVDMVYSGEYYEGVYSATVQASVVYTGTDHVIEWSKSQAFTFDIRKLIPYSDILQFLDIAKTRYDAAKGTTNEAKERENYQLISALVDHIQLKAVSVSPGISSLMLEIQALIYKVTCTFIDEYIYSTDPVPPIDSQFFTEGVPLNRVLTINGVAQDLTQDRVWNVGTVTSVNVAVPSWMTVSGGPITESGVITLGLAAGYVIPTEDQVAEWGLAYDKYIIGIGVSGSATKTITLTRNDGTLLTAQFNDIDTFPVTSVNTKTGDVVLVTDDVQEGVGAVNLWFTQARARASVSLTTIGNSGPSTYNQSTGVFNVPNYTLTGLGGVPFTRNITINGTQFDLSADRVWNVGTVTQINTGAGLIGGPITGLGTISHADTSALLGLYGGSGIASLTVDEFGHVTAVVTASYVPTSRTLSINGIQFDLSANRSWSVGTVTSVDMTVPVGFAISGNPITTAGTLALGFATGYSLPTDVRQGQWDVAYDNRITSLTTIGNSGPSTLISHVLNIPNYTLAGLGGVPLTRTITINGQTFDLSQDRTFTVNIGVSSASGISPIIVSPSTGDIVISHADSGVTPGTYNSFTVDSKGHITAASVQLTGHVIQNNGISMTQRTNLNFIRMIVEDDSTGNATKVTRPPSVTISTLPPTLNVLEGDEWIDDNTWKKYAWYDGYWAEVGRVCGGGSSGGETIVGSQVNGYVATIIDGVPTWYPVNDTSKWTLIDSNIYRNSRVLIGATSFSDTYAKSEISGGLKVSELMYQTPLSSTISANTTLSLSMSSGQNLRRYLLQANLTINFSSNLAASDSSTYTFVFKQDAVGGRVVNWNLTGASVLWQGGVVPIIADGANEITVITIIWTGQEYLGVKSCGFNV